MITKVKTLCACDCMESGKFQERERLIQLLEEYLEVTQLPGDYGIEINKEWDAGFNAALALIKGEQK